MHVVLYFWKQSHYSHGCESSNARGFRQWPILADTWRISEDRLDEHTFTPS